MLRDDKGRFISVVALPLGIQSNHYAEAVTAYHSIRMAYDKGYKRVWIEGDSLNIIESLKEIQRPGWTIDMIIKDSINLIKSFENVLISHIFREGNGLAEVITNEGVTACDIKRYEKLFEMPSKAKHLVINEGNDNNYSMVFES